MNEPLRPPRSIVFDVKEPEPIVSAWRHIGISTMASLEGALTTIRHGNIGMADEFVIMLAEISNTRHDINTEKGENLIKLYIQTGIFVRNQLVTPLGLPLQPVAESDGEDFIKLKKSLIKTGKDLTPKVLAAASPNFDKAMHEISSGLESEDERRAFAEAYFFTYLLYLSKMQKEGMQPKAAPRKFSSR